MKAWGLIKSNIHLSYWEIGGCHCNMMWEILTWRKKVGGWDILEEDEAMVSTFQNNASSIYWLLGGTKPKGQMQIGIVYEGEVTQPKIL